MKEDMKYKATIKLLLIIQLKSGFKFLKKNFKKQNFFTSNNFCVFKIYTNSSENVCVAIEDKHKTLGGNYYK